MARPTASRSRRRIGLLGGTFDPPHVGHGIVARELVERLALDRLLVIPASDPPHRDTVFPAADRLAWVRRMFDGEDAIEVSDVEHRRDGPSYTVDTLTTLHREQPGTDWVLVMGADQFAALESWREPERVGELARIAVMRRAGQEPALPPGVGTIDYIAVDVTRIDVSASQVRERLRAGRTIRFLVPDSIRRDIERAWANIAPESRPEPASAGP